MRRFRREGKKKGNKMKKKCTSRKGKHREGKVSVGMYISEEMRALLAYLVDMSGMTATDIIMEGVFAKARVLGVMDSDNKIRPCHAAAIRVIMEAYHVNKTNKEKVK